MGKCLFMRKGETHTLPKVGLPSGYAELTYIESTGTQYIDTEFKPNQDTRVVMDFEIKENNPATTQSVFGCRTAFTSNDFTFWLLSDSSWLTNYATTTTTMSVSSVFGRHIVDKNKNTTVVDGESVSATYSVFQTPANLFLFTNNQNGTVDRTGQIKLYSCQIYDNGALVRDFIPCINPSGEIGLYDTVNKKFYGNKGTGTFIGSEVA